MNRKWLITGSYSLLHLLVDMACAVLFYSILHVPGIELPVVTSAVLAYDFFAFGLQLPFGMLADKWNRNALVSAAGCVLVALAFVFRPFAIFACVIAGVGNALFHVGGGIDVLNISEGKATLPGIFVSTGAMGLYLGQKWFGISFMSIAMVGALLAGAAFLVWFHFRIRNVYQIQNAPCESVLGAFNLSETGRLILLCMVTTVCIRSCLGLGVEFSWLHGFRVGLAGVTAVVFGKACGGILGDRFGWKRTSLVSLLLAAVFFFPAFNNIVCGLLALFFFNMTMPITLTVMADLLPKRKGAAFGLASAMLFLGAGPVLVGFGGLLTQKETAVGLTLLSAAILFYGLWRHEKPEEQETPDNGIGEKEWEENQS